MEEESLQSQFFVALSAFYPSAYSFWMDLLPICQQSFWKSSKVSAQPGTKEKEHTCIYKYADVS